MSVSILMLLAAIMPGGDYLGRFTRAEAVGQRKRPDRQHAATKVLYAQHCALCHGADGRARSPVGVSLRATNFADADWWKKERPTDARLTTSIRDGRGNMRPYGRDLSKKEIAALAAYVRTFKGK
ncbi:MAG TPA: cytochrome c [Pyrinomonadaceae bacterium]